MLYNIPNPHGGEVYSKAVEIDFSANINPLGTPEAVKEAVRDSLPLLSQYPDPYCRALVGAIAEFEGVPPERVLCGNGAAELIFSLCAALGPKRALLPVPSFSEYRTALEAAGCETEFYFMEQSEDFALTERFLPVLEGFGGDMLLLCNPNNPTGQVIDPVLLEEIRDICARKGIFLFIDECFLDLTQGGEGLSLARRLRDGERTLLLKAFTKSYGMAGLRLGYCLCADPALLTRMGRATQAWNVSIPAQMAGIAALGQREFLDRARAIIHAQRPLLAAGLEALGLTVIPSRTNFLLFFSPRALGEPLLERGLQIRDCANYPGLEPGWYRTAVRLPEQNQRLLDAIKEILNG